MEREKVKAEIAKKSKSESKEVRQSLKEKEYYTRNLHLFFFNLA
jgi:hypothetical protein